MRERLRCRYVGIPGFAGTLPEVGADLRVPQSTAGQAVTADALGVVIGGPALTARLRRKPLALGLMLLFASGSALSAWAPSFTMSPAGRVISSLSHAAFVALALVMATSVVRPSRPTSVPATSAPPPAPPQVGPSSPPARCAGPDRPAPYSVSAARP
ncbi:membrane protein [Streptomyces noursei ATCC 11455]|nr:membrane protein [Streptomyces noursei ATCC 11455]